MENEKTNENSQPQQTIESQLLNMTTIVECGLHNVVRRRGSGFFFSSMAQSNLKTQGTQRRKADAHWLITNRHFVLPKINDKEIIPDYFTFNLREITDDKKIEWLPITYSYHEICAKLKLHPDPLVDVAAINIEETLLQILKEREKNIIMPTNLTIDNLPGVSPLTVEVASDVAVVSYPRGFYDKVNKFPIVKSGIVASAWGSHFDGRPTFLIDAKLFPGSSGGLVVSKPTNMIIMNGRPSFNNRKQFLFLGVYSGESLYQSNKIEIDEMTIIKKESYSIGNVWYSKLVTAIIEKGLSIRL